MTDWQLISSQDDFHDAVQSLANGTGVIGVDAERASGYKYAQSAYLIQFYREAAGTYLFDPIGIESFAELQDSLSDVEWVFHAASQDLPCLREVGLNPETIFDTELAARLLGLPRVGLGAVVEELLGVHLAKEHSAVDWSTRPLPDPWLNYAASDVTLLPDLREILAQQLAESGKTEYAHEEFLDVLERKPKLAPEEPWRRMSGIHHISGLRNLAVARELWLARDELARSTDVSPGRLIPDAALVAASQEMPRSKGQLAALKTFHGRASRRELDRWWEAIIRGRETEDLPILKPHNSNTMPPHRTWKNRFPEAYERLTLARNALTVRAEDIAIPLENLMTPEILRRICWHPPTEITAENISLTLHELGARPWQIKETGQIITDVFIDIIQNPSSHNEETSLEE
ncbi:ribonuclease D [Klugiella xanthotipulae]|uniref:Ribonuclease D n=1 Tax=Klugiella xanthotipulae TaxID=244735 RepID=A0A543HSD2_9MICO|nr:HRDC domain-containing protein [Klugiella xanthotipulae]TQM61179.1 ribonuclease D [Klugiella xanthotipulae]